MIVLISYVAGVRIGQLGAVAARVVFVLDLLAALILDLRDTPDVIVCVLDELGIGCTRVRLVRLGQPAPQVVLVLYAPVGRVLSLKPVEPGPNGGR